jgi:hypothetical protein
MPIIIPEAGEQGTSVAPQTSAALLPTPTIPAPAAPGHALPAAFGANVARASQQLAETGQKVARNLLKMAIDDQNNEVVKLETSSRQDIQNILSNPEIETIDVQGQPLSRPKGLLNRTLTQAKGVTAEYDQSLPGLKKKYLNGLSAHQVEQLSPAIDKYFTQQRSRVIAHEARQRDADILNSVDSNIKQKTLDASTIRTSEGLAIAINDAVNVFSLVNQKFDPATQKLNNEKIAADITMASVISTLQNTGLDEAQSILAGVEGMMEPGTHELLTKQFKKNIKEYQAIQESELIDLKINEELTVSRVLREREMKHITAKTAQTLIKSLQKKPEQDTFSKASKYNELVERNAILNKKERGFLFFGEVTFEEAIEFKSDVLDANSKGLITNKQMEDLLSDTSRRFYGEPVFQDALDQLAAQSSFYAIPTEQSRAKAEMYENLTRKVAAGTDVREAVNEVISEKLSTDVERAVLTETEREQTSIIINPAIQTKITELQKTMSDDQIKGFLREKNINPDNYEF